MILYCTYFFLLAMFILSTSKYFIFLFNLLHVPSGARTVVIQMLSVLISALIVIFRKSHGGIAKEIGKLLIVWIPFLLFLVIRTDFDDLYSTTKFGKIVMIHFLCAVTVTAVYLASTTEFNKYFYPTVIVLSALLGIEAIVNPQVFHYRTVIERLTIEELNPIWLARTFALAALCLVLMPIRKRQIKLVGVIVCIAGILPTGSRGPLIALIITLGVYWLVYQRVATLRKGTKIAIVTTVVVGLFLAAGPDMEEIAARYFERGQRGDMLDESGRPALFARALREFSEAPLVGVGLGNYGQGTIRLSSARGSQGIYPHNIFLEMLAEAGLIGFGLFVMILRPGRWLVEGRSPYTYLFYLCLLFSMTSGDMSSNAGVTLFAVLARLSCIQRELGSVQR